MHKLLAMIALPLFLAGLSGCGSGGGGESSSNTTTVASTADFSGTWSGTFDGIPLEFLITQTGNNLAITRTSPAAVGPYTGLVNGDSAVVTAFINGTSAGTSTWTLLNSTTVNNVVTSCTPPPGFTCAAPGTAITLTRNAATALSLKGIILDTDPSNFNENQANPLTIAPGSTYGLWAAGSNASGSSTSNIRMCGKCATQTTCTSDTGNRVGFAQSFTLNVTGDPAVAFIPALCSGGTLSIDLTNVASGATLVLTMTVDGGVSVQKTLNVQ